VIVIYLRYYVIVQDFASYFSNVVITLINIAAILRAGGAEVEAQRNIDRECCKHQNANRLPRM
jgi:hypothetical protein